MRSAQLVQSFNLNLTNAFPGKVQFLAELAKRLGLLIAQTIPTLDDKPFLFVKLVQQLLKLSLERLGDQRLIYFLAPSLLGLVNAAPEVQAEALPYLRIMFLFSFGMMFFFMVGGALRSAGDQRVEGPIGRRIDGLGDLTMS